LICDIRDVGVVAFDTKALAAQFGGARLLTSRLARTLAPPKMETDPLPKALVTLGEGSIRAYRFE
jgi:hypothetical protein